MERRLAAILAADVVGYSRLMGVDESGTLTQLMAHRNEFIDPTIAAHRGRIVKLMGDGALVEFASVVDALACAVDIQRGMKERNQDQPAPQRIEFRIGINLGDVIVEGDDIYGDGVNVAARLEGLAEPGGVCISDSVRTAVGHKLPLDYEFLGEQQVKNIAEPVRAYRTQLQVGAELPKSVVASESVKKTKSRPLIVGAALAVVVIGVLLSWLKPWVSEIEPAADDWMVRPLTEKPSIAVLPFNNLSGDPEQEYFADGMTDDLITDLSKVSGLFVIARNSTFAYKGQSPDVRQVAQDLGVRYVIEGSVRRAGDKVRINAQLIDATSGGHVWAERFDGSMADVFSLQDNVNERIVSALAVNLTADDRKRLAGPRTANPDAYDVLLRGLEFYQRFNQEDNLRARELFNKAATLDDSYARAHANIGLTYASEVNFNWTDRRDESARLGIEHASRAFALNQNIPQIYMTRSFLHLAQRDHGAAMVDAQKLVELYPNYADSHTALAFVSIYTGELELGLEAIARAKRLNPRYSYIYLAVEGHLNFLKGEYENAVALYEEALERNPVFDRGLLLFAAALAHMGNTEDAAWAIAEALSIRPDLTLGDERRDANYKRPEDLKRYLEGLRRAGLPE